MGQALQTVLLEVTRSFLPSLQLEVVLVPKAMYLEPTAVVAALGVAAVLVAQAGYQVLRRVDPAQLAKVQTEAMADTKMAFINLAEVGVAQVRSVQTLEIFLAGMVALVKIQTLLDRQLEEAAEAVGAFMVRLGLLERVVMVAAMVNRWAVQPQQQELS